MGFFSDNVARIELNAAGRRLSSKARELKAAGRDVNQAVSARVRPDFDTPDNIKDAAARAMRDGDTKYTAVDGTPALKAALIIAKFARENDLAYEPAQISVGTGGKPRCSSNALMAATLNRGDEVGHSVALLR